MIEAKQVWQGTFVHHYQTEEMRQFRLTSRGANGRVCHGIDGATCPLLVSPFSEHPFTCSSLVSKKGKKTSTAYLEVSVYSQNRSAPTPDQWQQSLKEVGSCSFCHIELPVSDIHT